MNEQPSPHEERTRVLIAGGGVAALEALLALKELAGDRVAPLLFAPDQAFRHRPLSVTEPFGDTKSRELDLAEIALEHGATYLCDGLDRVDAEAHIVHTSRGRELEYDALLIAIGARGSEGVPGALTFRDSADRDAFREILDEIDRGVARRIVFAVPGESSWPLGLYELAMLTRAHVREEGLEGVELTIVTPEAHPMEIFGQRASDTLRVLLDEAGIVLRLSARPVSAEDGGLELEGGERIDADRVVSLPLPEVPEIPGIPQQQRGFIPVDRFGAVLETERVFAAGDSTWFPIKQGGLAAQQADCAAASIAELAGAEVQPQPFSPVLRGALLTEWGPRYMRAAIGHGGEEDAAKSVLWWPPAKVAGRYLAPFLAAKAGYRPKRETLTDLDAPLGEDAADPHTDHEDVVAMALSSADQHAATHDYSGALRWLEVAEDLELYLPREYELKRASWQGQTG